MERRRVSLSPAQIISLLEIEDVWPDRAIVVIGATALGFYYDMTWRQTADVDLVVAVEIDEFPGPLAGRAGWAASPDREHEFRSPNGSKVDILPAGDELLRTGTLIWSSGHAMSLTGIDLAFRHAESHIVEGDLVIKVAPPSVVTLLKMAAYLDRPQERQRDLDDIAYLLELYVDDNAPRFWDAASECRDYDLVSAYLLGRDIGHIVEEPHLELVERFLSRLADTEGIEHAQMQRRGPRRWSTETRPLSRRLQSLRDGLMIDRQQ
jgi:predicted nucleotidyltransferase